MLYTTTPGSSTSREHLERELRAIHDQCVHMQAVCETQQEQIHAQRRRIEEMRRREKQIRRRFAALSLSNADS